MRYLHTHTQAKHSWTHPWGLAYFNTSFGRCCPSHISAKFTSSFQLMMARWSLRQHLAQCLLKWIAEFVWLTFAAVTVNEQVAFSTLSVWMNRHPLALFGSVFIWHNNKLLALLTCVNEHHLTPFDTVWHRFCVIEQPKKETRFWLVTSHWRLIVALTFLQVFVQN